MRGINGDQVAQIKQSQELTKDKFKCCFCASQVETAPGATHATCPKCGLVDTSDIEPLEAKSGGTVILDTDPLDDIIAEAVAKVPPPKSDDIILSDEDIANLLDEEPATKRKPEPKKVQEPAPKPTKAVASSTPTTNSGDDLVSEVISDFMVELEKAGMTVNA